MKQPSTQSNFQVATFAAPGGMGTPLLQTEPICAFNKLPKMVAEATSKEIKCALDQNEDSEVRSAGGKAAKKKSGGIADESAKSRNTRFVASGPPVIRLFAEQPTTGYWSGLQAFISSRFGQLVATEVSNTSGTVPLRPVAQGGGNGAQSPSVLSTKIPELDWMASTCCIHGLNSGETEKIFKFIPFTPQGLPGPPVLQSLESPQWDKGGLRGMTQIGIPSSGLFAEALAVNCHGQLKVAKGFLRPQGFLRPLPRNEERNAGSPVLQRTVHQGQMEGARGLLKPSGFLRPRENQSQETGMIIFESLQTQFVNFDKLQKLIMMIKREKVEFVGMVPPQVVDEWCTSGAEFFESKWISHWEEFIDTPGLFSSGVDHLGITGKIQPEKDHHGLEHQARRDGPQA